MWPSESTADLLFSVANVALIASLCLTVIATIGAVWMANVREGYLKRDLAASNERIAEAEETSAIAVQRAAEANRIAEEERLARTKLEERMRPRELSAEQSAAMLSILKDAPKGTVFINPDWTNPEAKIFAAHIAAVLELSGYFPGRLKGDSAPLSYGKLGAFLVIQDGQKPPAHLKPIYDALKAAGYDFLVYEESYVPEDAVLIGISAK